MRRVVWLLFLTLSLTAACDQPEPTRIQVGTHAVSLMVPPDWEHFDSGEKHQFRKDFERIAVEDMGRMGWNIDKAIERALVQLREDGRRETASRDSFQVSGRPARAVDTWDHLSHQYRKRYVFVMNEKSLLALYMAQGQFELMDAVFEGLKTSLAFTDSLDLAGLPDTEGGD